jgi:hypothetical protein
MGCLGVNFPVCVCVCGGGGSHDKDAWTTRESFRRVLGAFEATPSNTSAAVG